MMKKGIFIFTSTFIFLMVALFAVGCGGGPTETPKQQIIIRFYSEDAELSSTLGEVGRSITMPQEPQRTDYAFDGWYLDNNIWLQVFDTDYLKNNVKPASPLIVYAKWARLRNLDLSVNIQSGGTIQGEAGAYKENEEITVIAVPKEGYSFDGWYEGEIEKSNDAEYTFSMPARALTLIAKFIVLEGTYVQLSVSSENTGIGTVSGNRGNIAINSSVTIIAEPLENYTFNGWYSNGKMISLDVEYSFTITEQMSLVAKFTRCDIFTFTWDEQGFYYISQLEGYSYGDMIIPATYDGYPVAAIGDQGFTDNDTITSIIISEGVQAIGPGAFNYCDTITSLYIPSTFNYLGVSPFMALSSLEAFEVSPDNEDFKEVDGVLFSKDGTLLISYPAGKTDTDYEVPHGVQYLFSGCFYGSYYLQNVIISSTVTTIYDSAFEACFELKRIFIPNSVSQISTRIFYADSNLSSIYCESAQAGANWDSDWNKGRYPIVWNHSKIPSTYVFDTNCGNALDPVTSIFPINRPSSLNGNQICMWYDNATFSGSKIVFPYYSAESNTIYAKWEDSTEGTEGLAYTLINEGTEYEVSGIGTATNTDIIIPSAYLGLPVTSIGNSAFMKNQTLISVVIASGIKKIGDNAFKTCSELDSVYISETVSEIGTAAFSNCRKLQYIKIPAGVSKLKRNVFGRCMSLEEVEFEEGTLLTYIDHNAFDQCSMLRIINLPDDIQYVDSTAFRLCSSLEAFYLPESNVYYKTVDGVLFSKDGTELVCYPSGKKDEIYSVPGSITQIAKYAFSGARISEILFKTDSQIYQIDEYAFANCPNLISVSLPESLYTIGRSLFADCTSLQEITVASSNNQFMSVDGILFNKEGTMLLAYPAGKNLNSYTLPSSVNVIASDAFRKTALSSLIINATVPLILGDTVFTLSNIKIYVPEGSLNDYKTARDWSDFSNKIFPLDETALP